MLSRLKVWFENLFKKKQEYKLIDTFGCTERPSVSCPTFLERKVHTQFLNAVQSYNIIVVYGESRQGKHGRLNGIAQINYASDAMQLWTLMH